MSKQERPCEWLGRDEMAAAFGVTTTHFDRHLRPMIPADAVRQDGRRVHFRCRAAIDAFVAHEVAKQEEKLQAATDSLLVGDSHSPALERYRAARADMAEMQAKVMRGELASLNEIVEGLLPLAALIRQSAEQLDRKFGAEAREIVEEALKGFESQLPEVPA